MKETEKDSMKLGIPVFPIVVVFLTMSFCTGIVPSRSIAAGNSEREYEVALRMRKRDFDRHVLARLKGSDSEKSSSDAIRATRKSNEKKFAEIEKAYQKKLRRYSMEEVEMKERIDEERLRKQGAHDEKNRIALVKIRDRQARQEATVAPIDPYVEFDINLKKDPESKVTQIEKQSTNTAQ